MYIYPIIGHKPFANTQTNIHITYKTANTPPIHDTDDKMKKETIISHFIPIFIRSNDNKYFENSVKVNVHGIF